MSGAPIIAVVILVRLLVIGFRKGKGGSAVGGRPVRGGLLLIMTWMFGPALVATLAGAVAAGAVGAAVPLALLGVVMFPWAIATRVLVPLGLPRAAYFVAFVSDFFWRVDHRGGAAVAAARAILCQRQPDEKAIAWVEAQLSRPRSLRGGGIVAAALLASARGDLDTARVLMHSVATLSPAVCPRIARRMAREWLAAEAASRGDWGAVAALGAPPPAKSADGAAVATHGPSSRATYLLIGAARRLLGYEPAPSPARLWLLFAMAPRRRLTFAFVASVLDQTAIGTGRPRRDDDSASKRSAGPPNGSDAEASEVPDRHDAFASALSRHAALVGTPPRRIEGREVVRAAEAWDALFEEPALEQHVLERAFVLGVDSGGSAVARLRATVEEDLADVVGGAGLGLDDLDVLGGTLTRVTRRLRDDVLSELELRSDAMRVRVDEGRALPPVDEWQEWTSLRILYDRGVAIGGIELRRLAFHKLHRDVTHLAVWLFNVRKERALANAMFRWALAESELLGDAAGVELQRKNVSCGV